MNDGLIQFLVIAAFVIISMMDGAARRRRKAAQRLESSPTPEGFPEVADELGQADEPSGGSEGMVPQDLGEEIAALARGERPASRQEQLTTGGPGSTGGPNWELEEWTAPEHDIPAQTRSTDLQGGYLHADQALTHREHAQVEVASPAGPLLEEFEDLEELPSQFVPHPAEQPSRPQKELPLARRPRSLLSGVRLGTKSSLREAIVLAEVLSPPLTLRDSGWKPLF